MSGRAVAVRDTASFGTKRVCVSCAAKFYDFNKASFTCPKCGTEQTATTPSRLAIDDLIIKDDEADRRKLAALDESEVDADADDEMEELDIDSGDDDLGDDAMASDEEYSEDEEHDD